MFVPEKRSGEALAYAGEYGLTEVAELPMRLYKVVKEWSLPGSNDDQVQKRADKFLLYF